MTTTADPPDPAGSHPALPRARHTISEAAFEQLRTTELGLQATLGIAYPTDHGFDPFEMTFAQLASWAVWAQPTPGVTGTGWSRDNSVLASYDD